MSILLNVAIMQKAWSDKINLFINPEEADVIKLGGVNVEDVVHKETEAAISREAEDRWRCGVRKCTKLFLEEKFVRSHIQKRHKDWLEKIALEVSLFTNLTNSGTTIKQLRPGSMSYPGTFSRDSPKWLWRKTSPRQRIRWIIPFRTCINNARVHRHAPIRWLWT
jgi:hypothetical protein